MIHTRPAAGHRLPAVIALVLAITAGVPASLLLAPAQAATASTQTVHGTGDAEPAADQAAVGMPTGVVVNSVGTTGFLSMTEGGDSRWVWTRFADGTTTELDGTAVLGSASDVVLVEQGDVYTLRDMSGGSAPVRIDRSEVDSRHKLFRVVGSTLVMTSANTTGGTDLHFVDKPDGTLRDRQVTGLPADATLEGASVDAPAGMLIVRYCTGVGRLIVDHLALVDIATGTVTATRDIPDSAATVTSFAASTTHIVWGESSREHGRTLVVAPIGTGEAERTELGGSGTLSTDVLGDWVVYAQPRGGQAAAPDPLHALTARSLVTGATVKLLDHTLGVRAAPDGSLFAQGGTVAQGEGLYRISLGAEGDPVAIMVASTGEPTAVTILGNTIPGVIDLDRNRGVASLDTTVSRPNTRLKIELVHTASRRKWTVTRVPSNTYGRGAETISVPWDGRFDLVPGEKGEFAAAYNGAYTWHMKATPLNGIGPAVEASGAFTVTRKQGPHDFSDNGSPDLLVIDPGGRLNRYDSAYRQDSNTLYWPSVSYVGSGWLTYDRFTSAGNLGGTPFADIVARDKTGGLWVYDGTGSAGSFAPRKRVGSGWQIFDKITAGGDFNSDGKPDLVAADKAGVLWLYTGTGNINAPFSPRKRIGAGWGIFNQITAAGNIAGSGAGDLVARDKDGVLWLYLGKGNGTFAARTRIGAGWNAYSSLVAVGDANRDGRPDLVGYGAGPAYLYTSTGDPTRPLASRRATTGTWPSVKNIAVF